MSTARLPQMDMDADIPFDIDEEDDAPQVDPFAGLANTGKTRPVFRAPVEESESDDDYDAADGPDQFVDAAEQFDPNGIVDDDMFGGAGMGGHGHGMNVGPSAIDHEQMVQAAMKLREEKYSLLQKIQVLSSRGLPCPIDPNMKTPLEQLRYHHDLMRRHVDVQNAIKLQRRVLVATVSGVEWANGKWDPLGARLDGWSEQVMSDLDSFDGVFERLYDKYKDRVSMPPEVELFLTLAGSAVMFHMIKSASSSMGMPSGMSFAKMAKDNPELVKNMVKAMAQQYAGQGGGQGPSQQATFQTPPNAPRQAPALPPPAPLKPSGSESTYIMRAPLFSIPSVPGFGSGGPQPQEPTPPPMPPGPFSAPLFRGPPPAAPPPEEGVSDPNLGSGIEGIDFQNLPHLENAFPPLQRSPREGDVEDADGELDFALSDDIRTIEVDGKKSRSGRAKKPNKKYA